MPTDRVPATGREEGEKVLETETQRLVTQAEKLALMLDEKRVPRGSVVLNAETAMQVQGVLEDASALLTALSVKPEPVGYVSERGIERLRNAEDDCEDLIMYRAPAAPWTVPLFASPPAAVEPEGATQIVERLRNELLGADQHVPSKTWKQGIRDAITDAEKWLGVE